HERGQAEHTQRTYAALLNRFVGWAGEAGLSDWKAVELKHLMGFLQHERERGVEVPGRKSQVQSQISARDKGSTVHGTKRLSSESLYLEIAALRAFYRFAENEKLLPLNIAENLSLPRRWKKLPKALTSQEIEKLLAPEKPETPQ